MKNNRKKNHRAGIIRFVGPVLMTLAILACGHKNSDNAVVAPEGMHVLNLSKYGKPFAIFVPDTVKLRMHITEQSSGALDIRVGTNFAISINEQVADIELRKKDIKDDEVNKLKKMLVDEPQAIMWESEITQPEFHFLLNKKIGNSDYSFEDIRDTEANPFGREAVQKMFDSGKNIQEIKKETNS